VELWNEFFALVLSVESGKLGWLEWWWLGVFIAPNHYSSHWLCYLSTGTPDSSTRTGHCTVHCPVHATSADHWGLEQLIVKFTWTCGAPDSPVRPDVADCPWPSDALDCGGSRPLVKLTVACGLIGQSDAHMTVQWILVAELCVFPRVTSLFGAPAWAPDSPMRRRLLQSWLAPNLELSQGSFPYMCIWTLCTWEKIN
jgi:hypothetical protein